MTSLEHVNMTVPDIDAALKFLAIAAPDFSVRKDALSERGYRWVHVGNDHSYLALQETHPGSTPLMPLEAYVNYGFNHLGLEVDSVASLESKLLAAGYRQNGPLITERYRKRLYFWDAAGMEWEMVEYLSGDTRHRHHFE